MFTSLFTSHSWAFNVIVQFFSSMLICPPCQFQHFMSCFFVFLLHQKVHQRTHKLIHLCILFLCFLQMKKNDEELLDTSIRVVGFLAPNVGGDIYLFIYFSPNLFISIFRTDHYKNKNRSMSTSKISRFLNDNRRTIMITRPRKNRQKSPRHKQNHKPGTQPN